MTKSAIIIRSIAQLDSSELNSIIELAGFNSSNLDSRGDLAVIARFKEAIQEEDMQGVRLLLEESEVRDYLHLAIMANTGHQVILHRDENVTNTDERKYILNKLSQLKPNMHAHLLYVGGGHGGYVGLSTTKLLSGLGWESIQEISNALQQNGVTVDAVILHSCSSAMFLRFFRPLLTAEGVMLSYSAELGASSNWEMTVQWMSDATYNDFFSAEALAKPWEFGDLGVTTSVISTKHVNTLMKLENSALPDYVDHSDESELQRQLVLQLVRDEEDIMTFMNTDVEQFNDVTVMGKFNEHLHAAVEEQNALNNADFSNNSFPY